MKKRRLQETRKSGSDSYRNRLEIWDADRGEDARGRNRCSPWLQNGDARKERGLTPRRGEIGPDRHSNRERSPRTPQKTGGGERAKVRVKSPAGEKERGRKNAIGGGNERVFEGSKGSTIASKSETKEASTKYVLANREKKKGPMRGKYRGNHSEEDRKKEQYLFLAYRNGSGSRWQGKRIYLDENAREPAYN